MTRADNERVELVARARELIDRATPISTEIRREDRGDGQDRYVVSGVPCGFPVAKFGDHNDAELFVFAATKLRVALEGAQVTDAITPEMIEAGALEYGIRHQNTCYPSASDWECEDAAKAIYTKMRSAAPAAAPDEDAELTEEIRLAVNGLGALTSEQKQAVESATGYSIDALAYLLVKTSLSRSADAVLVEALQKEKSFVWKWIERAGFDTQLSREECIDTLLHYPGAPWNEGRWDVDHKPYAARFYKQFPKAAALASADKQSTESAA